MDERLGEIETAMEALQGRLIRFEVDEYAIAGAFVSIDISGRLRVERGYVGAEDEPVAEADDASYAGDDPMVEDAVANAADPAIDPDEDEDAD